MCAWLFVIAASACTSLSEHARDAFSTDYSCPGDRIKVADLGVRKESAAAPTEVAQDPGRLQVWQHNHPAGPSRELFEVEGCGQRQHYICRHGTGDPDPEAGEGLLNVLCFPVGP